MTNLSTEIQQTEKTISELQPLTDDQIREAVAGGGDAEELIEREETKARRLRVERIKLSDLQRRYSAETQDKAKKEFEKVERQRAQTVEQSSRSLSAMLEAVASLEAAVAEFDELSEKARREFQQMTAHAKGAGLKFPAFGARGPLGSDSFKEIDQRILTALKPYLDQFRGCQKVKPSEVKSNG